MRTTHVRRTGGTLLALGVAATLVACSTGGPGSATYATGGADATGASSSGPRLAVSSEGRVTVLDGETLETVGAFDSEEFTRLNPAGDGRHVMVTTSGGFQVLDTAATAKQAAATR